MWALKCLEMVRNYFPCRAGCHHQGSLYVITLFVDVGNDLRSFVRPLGMHCLGALSKSFQTEKVNGQRLGSLA